jgi:hypothetical protein
MQKQALAVARVCTRDRERVMTVDDGDVRDESFVKDGVQNHPVVDGLLGEPADPGAGSRA